VQSVQFLDVLSRMIPHNDFKQLCNEYAPRPRSTPLMSAEQIVSGFIYHQLQEGGTLATNSGRLHGIQMSDSAYAQRRQLLPVELFEQILSSALSPLADPNKHPECFFYGYRLVGIDGTQFSVVNTAAILAQLPKAASRRFQAAFAKLRLVSLVELGTHAPLAACAGPAKESEQELARRVWEQVPEQSLVIGDRLFGTARTLWEATQAWQERDIAVLARVRENIQMQVLERLADGSALIEVPVREGKRTIASLTLREVQAHGVGINGKAFTLRLWTTLLDPKRYPAEELARNYAERWEQELYYRELKLDVRNAPALASQTPETALQEIAALVLASAVLARLRVEAGNQLRVPPQRMSFYKIKLATQPLWDAYEVMGDTLSDAQRQKMWEYYVELVRRSAVLPERRARSCPRVLRQPVSSWPRKTDQPSYTGSVQIKLVPV
jgi:DDE family transposase